MTPDVAALFVAEDGPYPLIEGVDCWTEARNAQLYNGPHPVVAHPPCQLWTNFAASNYARAKALCKSGEHCPVVRGTGTHGRCDGTGRREPNRKIVTPAWYEGGHDGGNFVFALSCVLRYGGVLEHPAYTHAWEHYGLTPPNLTGWSREKYYGYGTSPREYWVCEVQQSVYGHKAQKRTWLLYCGRRAPFELRWEKRKGTHQIGWFDRSRPTVSKREACASPVEFAEELIALARWSRSEETR